MEKIDLLIRRSLVNLMCMIEYMDLSCVATIFCLIIS